MEELISQAQTLLMTKNLLPEIRNEWLEKLTTLSEENLRDLIVILQAKTKEELIALQQKNIAKLDSLVTELKKITNEGVKLIYHKGEELAQAEEKEEGEKLLVELEEV